MSLPARDSPQRGPRRRGPPRRAACRTRRTCPGPGARGRRRSAARPARRTRACRRWGTRRAVRAGWRASEGAGSTGTFSVGPLRETPAADERTWIFPGLRAIGNLDQQAAGRLLARRRRAVVGRPLAAAEVDDRDVRERRPADLQHLAAAAARGAPLGAHQHLRDRPLRRHGPTGRRRRRSPARLRRCSTGRRAEQRSGSREGGERSRQGRLGQVRTPCRLCWCLRGELTGSRRQLRYDSVRSRSRPYILVPPPRGP